MTQEQHSALHRGSLGTRLDSAWLPVHCDRTDRCGEDTWRALGVKEEECYTLCNWCHLGKHSIWPDVLMRDRFQCTECGKKAEDSRRWFEVVTVHRLEGYCREEAGRDADPVGFVTLCHDCHKKKHPDDFTEHLRLGFEMSLPEIIRDHANKLGIKLPITSKDQLAPYREYLRVVNVFIDRFRKRGVPKESRIRPALLKLAETPLSSFLRRQAALEAIKAFERRVDFTLKQERLMKKMGEEQRQAYLKERKEDQLDTMMRVNAAPSMFFLVGKAAVPVSIWEQQASDSLVLMQG
jgi:hypothetical protein